MSNNDLPDEGVRLRRAEFATARCKFKELGKCETINCGRGAAQSAFNLRVSKGFRIAGNARIEAIGEIFNLFNAKNPGTFTTRRYLGSTLEPEPGLPAADGVRG